MSETWKKILGVVIGTVITGLLGLLFARWGIKVELPPLPAPIERNYYQTPMGFVDEDEMLQKLVERAEEQPTIVRESVVRGDNAKWHQENDQRAIQGLKNRKRGDLDRTTRFIRDGSVRDAGQKFLAALKDTGMKDAEGMPVYKIDRGAIGAIDPAKLLRWAEITLFVLKAIEPFIPPPYNLAVHAAVMLLEKWIDSKKPPAEIFPPNPELDWSAMTPQRRHFEDRAFHPALCA